MEEKPEKQTQKAGKIARIIGIIAIVGVIFAAMIISFNQKVPNSDKVWDKDTVIGNMEAKNYFIIYSDIACPYCVAFENAILENKEDFNRYIKDNDVLVEIRLSDFLYEYGQSNPISSRHSAEAIYCAKREGKFWDYYDLAISTVWNNYFKDMGKTAFGEMNALGKDYWIKLGKNVGLGDNFEKCVKNDEPLKEIMEVAAKTSKAIDGMPYFKFNSYISSGFDMSWGWDYVKMYFDTGLKSK
ncbi:MAG: thioredoxin domain-containing protein [Candidatus Saccharibacteria bacterium]|nr:thioredoxin domain-containing protein [Candidatus Saccharibacteria bacterium]